MSLYGKKSVEKFKVVIGFNNLACCNMCVSTDGYKAELRAFDTTDLHTSVYNLLQQYNPSLHIDFMNSLKSSYLTEHQFAQLVGKMRLYQYLPQDQKKELPSIIMTDTQLNVTAKNYYQGPDFHFNKKI